MSIYLRGENENEQNETIMTLPEGTTAYRHVAPCRHRLREFKVSLAFALMLVELTYFQLLQRLQSHG